MSSDVIDVVRQRKNFYRDNYRRALQALFFCLIVIVGLIIAIFLVRFTQPKTTFYATSSDGGLAPIQSTKWGARIIQPSQTVANQT